GLARGDRGDRAHRRRALGAIPARRGRKPAGGGLKRRRGGFRMAAPRLRGTAARACRNARLRRPVSKPEKLPMDRRFLLKAGAAGSAVLAAPFVVTRAYAQNYRPEYRVSTVVGTAFPWGQGAQIWIDLVRERTQGRINMKLYPNVSLVNGDQTREFSAIRQGVIDLAVGSTINWSPQIRQLNLFSLPFLARDHAGIDAMTQGEVGKQILALVEKAGVVPLAWGANGFRELTNSKHEIRSPADMKGLKFRVVGSPIFNDTFTALGANPTQMSWAD